MKRPLGEIKQSEPEKERLLKMIKVAINIEFQLYIIQILKS